MGPTQPHINVYRGLKRPGPEADHSQLVPRLTVSRAILLLSLRAVVDWTGVTLPLYFCSVTL
jgi:hypothetical protein